jgi:hypothetical protein
MEGMSIYWQPIWQVLASNFLLKLDNPYFIKQQPNRKSDMKDAHSAGSSPKTRLASSSNWTISCSNAISILAIYVSYQGDNISQPNIEKSIIFARFLMHNKR